jgi:hypothetical protein
MSTSAAWSRETRVMAHPWATYRDLTGRPPETGWPTLLRRPALFALILGACLSLTTSGRFTFRLILGGAAVWSFAPLLQIAGAAAALPLARRRLPFSRAIDLYFLAHGPWSLWLLAVAGGLALLPTRRSFALLAPPTAFAWLSVLVPLGWSGIITFAFFREALAMSRGRALAGLAVHGFVVWGAVLAFFLLSGQLWPRILAALAP